MSVFDKLKERAAKAAAKQGAAIAKAVARKGAETAVSVAKHAGRKLEDAIFGESDARPPPSAGGRTRIDEAERKRKEDEVGERLRAADRRVKEREAAERKRQDRPDEASPGDGAGDGSGGDPGR